MIRMHFYVSRCSDGLIHVQNVLMGHMGQHHVHDEAGFEEWKKKGNIDEEDVIPFDKAECKCGYKAGEVGNL